MRGENYVTATIREEQSGSPGFTVDAHSLSLKSRPRHFLEALLEGTPHGNFI
jgi:hypothetical protein